MMLTNINTEVQCQICWSMVMKGDERCIVHHDDGDLLCCMICAAFPTSTAAERLGWCISV